MAVKTQLYLCYIQGVSVCTNVLANYMFRPLWICQLNSKIHNGDGTP